MTKWMLAPVVALSIAAPSFAQAVVGKWAGSSPNMNAMSNFSLELDEKGTGTLKGGNAAPSPITGAKIEGAKATFTTGYAMQGNQITISWTAEATGDDLVLKGEIPGQPGAIPAYNLKRVK